jgi:hypothetical protein
VECGRKNDKEKWTHMTAVEHSGIELNKIKNSHLSSRKIGKK